MGNKEFPESEHFNYSHYPNNSLEIHLYKELGSVSSKLQVSKQDISHRKYIEKWNFDIRNSPIYLDLVVGQGTSHSGCPLKNGLQAEVGHLCFLLADTAGSHEAFPALSSTSMGPAQAATASISALLPRAWCPQERSSLNLGLFTPPKVAEFLETLRRMPTASLIPENALPVNRQFCILKPTFKNRIRLKSYLTGMT